MQFTRLRTAALAAGLAAAAPALAKPEVHLTGSALTSPAPQNPSVGNVPENASPLEKLGIAYPHNIPLCEETAHNVTLLSSAACDEDVYPILNNPATKAMSLAQIKARIQADSAILNAAMASRKIGVLEQLYILRYYRKEEARAKMLRADNPSILAAAKEARFAEFKRVSCGRANPNADICGANTSLNDEAGSPDDEYAMDTYRSQLAKILARADATKSAGDAGPAGDGPQ